MWLYSNKTLDRQSAGFGPRAVVCQPLAKMNTTWSQNSRREGGKHTVQDLPRAFTEVCRALWQRKRFVQTRGAAEKAHGQALELGRGRVGRISTSSRGMSKGTQCVGNGVSRGLGEDRSGTQTRKAELWASPIW